MSATERPAKSEDCRGLEDKWFPTCVELWMFRFKADARRTSAVVTEWSQNWGHSAKLSC